MKVCTDSCIFGAYIQTNNANKILDIGTGTGLLSLMLAQKSEASINAVEIDLSSYKEASRNIQLSPWYNRIKLYNNSIQYFSSTRSDKYDLIISNPPFFKNHLKSGKKEKDQALHSDALSFEELVECVGKLLNPDGRFYILLPEYESKKFAELALKQKLFLNHRLLIRNTAEGSIFRVITEYSFIDNKRNDKVLIIKKNNSEYTDSFKLLLKDYYLNL